MLGIFFDSAKTSNFVAESFNGSTCFGFVMISCDLVQAPADWEHFIEKMLYISILSINWKCIKPMILMMKSDVLWTRYISIRT